jgi:hypothetical protein
MSNGTIQLTAKAWTAVVDRHKEINAELLKQRDDARALVERLLTPVSGQTSEIASKVKRVIDDARDAASAWKGGAK